MARWLIDVLNDLSSKSDKIISAWVAASIFAAVHYSSMNEAKAHRKEHETRGLIKNRKRLEERNPYTALFQLWKAVQGK